MLTCYLTRRKLGAWVDGALEGPSARLTGAHLEACARCRAEVESLSRLKNLLREATPVAEPDWTGFWPAIVRGIQDAREPERAALRRRWAWGRAQWALGVVAAALLLSLGLWQWLPGLQTSEAGVIIHTAHTDDPRGTVVAYSTPEQDVAVVWVLGLQND